jgi:hypothetical protein
MIRRRLSAEQVAQIVLLFPHHPTAYVAKELNLPTSTINNKAYILRLKKSPEYTAKFEAERDIRLAQGGVETRLQKGNIAHNKGKPMAAEVREKCAKSFFKKGQQPPNAKPIGYERIGKEGYIEVRTEKGFKPKQRIIWEQYFGAVPPKHIICFIDGDKRNFDIGNLELVSRADNATRNRFKYSPEYIEILGLLKQIDNKIKTLKNEK